MKNITSKQLRNAWIKFYEERGHVNIGAVSLIGDGSTGVMFNVAGMQPLMPYLLGKKHPKGTRLCNVQGCMRTVDIDEVGDESHFTFFEMMGNWSLGDYFKKEKTAWTFELLTKVFGLDKNKICATVFEGNNSAPRDEETASLLLDLGIKKQNIFYQGKADNWWELEGTVGTPCGPDNEWFYPLTDNECGLDKCDINCVCHRYIEIGNDVYMQYEKLDGGKYKPLSNKNVDTGFGFERMLMFLNGLTDGYKTDLFSNVISYIENASGKTYLNNLEETKSMRIVADHLRTTVMLIGDENSLTPSNTGAGYILRRLMRRAIRHGKSLGLNCDNLVEIAKIFIEQVYNEAYPLLIKNEQYILDEIKKEYKKFDTMLVAGTKEFEKVISGIIRKREFLKQNGSLETVENVINGKTAFRLYDTFGFPIEFTIEMAQEKGFSVDLEGFNKAFEEHKELARVQAGTFKGGLQGNSDKEIAYHTATHIMLAGLRKMFGTQTVQKGSNITSERMRFDFNIDHKLTVEELAELENFVNNAIQRKLEVTWQEIPFKQAIKMGAYGVHNAKDDELVKVYTIGDVDCQICGGPHVNNTSELGHFKIIKEESSSSGVRRIKAVLE